MSKIQIDNLNKSYYIGKSEYKVLKDLNLNLNEGEFVAIYGESGSGKSTLMNVVGGLDIFQSGEIKIEGENIEEFTNKSMDLYRNRKIGFIFQEFNLLENLKVIDNVIMPMNIAGVSDREARKRAYELLEKVGSRDQAKKKVTQLSGGQKQRIAIARALANDPDIILADEPTGALDSKTTKEILELLQSIAADGKLIVAITHSAVVADYATRVVNLVDGKIVENVGQDIDIKAESANIEFKKDYSKLSLRKAFKIAKANLMSKKFRTFLVALGVSLGIAGSIVITSISDNMIEQVSKQFSAFNSDPTLVNVAVFKSEDARTGEEENKEAEKILAIENLMKDYQGFETIYPERKLGRNVINEVEIENEAGEKEVREVETFEFLIEADYSQNNKYDLKFGNYPTNPREVYFNGNAFAIHQMFEMIGFESEVSVEDLMVIEFEEGNETYDKLSEEIENNLIGSTIEIEESEGNKVEYKIVGSSELSGVTISNLLLRAPYEHNKQAFDENYGEGKSSMFFVRFDSEANADAFIDDTTGLSKTGSGIDTNYNDYKLITIDLRAVMSLIDSVFAIVTNIFLVLIGVSLLVSVFMVNVIVYISTIERKVEIGTLRAIGAKKKDITAIFIGEGVLIGMFSFVFALIGAFILIMFANVARYVLSGSTGKLMFFNLSWPYLILIAAIVFVVMFLASLLPAIKASRQNPIDALREE